VLDAFVAAGAGTEYADLGSVRVIHSGLIGSRGDRSQPPRMLRRATWGKISGFCRATSWSCPMSTFFMTQGGFKYETLVFVGFAGLAPGLGRPRRLRRLPDRRRRHASDQRLEKTPSSARMSWCVLTGRSRSVDPRREGPGAHGDATGQVLAERLSSFVNAPNVTVTVTGPVSFRVYTRARSPTACTPCRLLSPRGSCWFEPAGQRRRGPGARLYPAGGGANTRRSHARTARTKGTGINSLLVPGTSW